MRNKYLYKISLKNLFANRLRTYLTLGGVIIGVGSIVFLVSLGFGLQRLVTSEVATLEEMKVANVNPGDSEILRLNGEATEKISTIAGVNKVGKMINVASRANYQSSVIDTVAYGIDNDYLNLEGIKADLGRMFSSQEAEEVVVNRTVLNLLGVEENQETMIDKTIKFDFIITSELLDKDGKKVVTGKELKIVGIEDNEGTPTIYLPIEFLKAQGIGYYSGLKLQSENPDQVPGIRDAVENMGYKTEYVGDTVTQIDQVFDIFKVVLAGFGSVAMVVAALGMFNTLTVSLLERIREVGLLKALGMSRADIRKLFLSEAMIIGIGGGLMGLILGLLVGYILNYSINALAIASGASPVDFFYMPWYFAVGMAIFSIIIGLLTGIYPAQRAVKINALDALRYE
jgi:putative ABC transport system permease protein